MARRCTNQMAPVRFARTPGEAAPHVQHLWRDLRFIVVPDAGSGAQNTGIRELVRGFRPNLAGFATPVGEANGRASRFAGAGVVLGPSSAAWQIGSLFSVFAFVVRRDASTTAQTLAGYGGRWGFVFNYGSGQIGLVRYGVADHPTTTLGAVPNDGSASTVAVAQEGTTATFMLNGKFQNRGTGAIGAPIVHELYVGRTAFNAPLQDTSVHVMYFWDRVISSAEMLLLNQDPWALIRPRQIVNGLAGVAAASGYRFRARFVG